MAEPVAIIGAATRQGQVEVMETAIRETVLAALADAGCGLEDIEAVVTVGSDLLDGGMVATRSGLAGSFGRSLVTVPSSAGHALGAAVAMIESGGVGRTLLVGWGEGTNFEDVDGRSVQADPFYARPLDADAAALAALQAQRLLIAGRVERPSLEWYVEAMSSRTGRSQPRPVGGAPGWLATGWSDGVCALVLAEASDRVEGVRLADFGMSFQPYCPDHDHLDPAGWVASAGADLRWPGGDGEREPVAVEVCGPTALVEAAALAGLLERWGWELDDPRVNRTGGGAGAFYGPATALGQLAGAVAALRAHSGVPASAATTFGGEQGPATAVVVDLAGPIGQATTVIVAERMAS